MSHLIDTIDHATRLEQAIVQYGEWMQASGYAEGTRRVYTYALRYFLAYVREQELAWEEAFSHATLYAFMQATRRHRAGARHAVRGLSRYLAQHGMLAHPREMPRPRLPEVYEQYLAWYDASRQVHSSYLQCTSRVLAALHDYLTRHGVRLSGLTIENVDGFLAEHNARYTAETRKRHRSILRGFLRYLHLHVRIVARDLSCMVVGRVQFAEAKPPKFLRPDEVRRLFASIDPTSSPRMLRSYAMLHLAYTLGLRPKEVSLLRLDDIAFQRQEVRLRARKALNPVVLPVPAETIKAVAAYLVGARPTSTHREVFINLTAPYRPVTAYTVSRDICQCLHQAGLEATAYWLRHTYAQTLLTQGQSIFTIKELLGHDVIQTTKRYLAIHTELMREVLFDETL